MSLSASVRPAVRVGLPTTHDGSVPVLPSLRPSGGEPPSPLTSDDLAFARRVRAPWWRSISPAIVTFLFGAALLLVAGSAPPSATVQRMLSADGGGAWAAEQSALHGPGADYVLPPHLQWLGLSGSLDGNVALACDPAGPEMAC